MDLKHIAELSNGVREQIRRVVIGQDGVVEVNVIHIPDRIRGQGTVYCDVITFLQIVDHVVWQN